MPTRRSRVSLAFVVLAAVVAVAAGCGGENEAAPPTTPSSSLTGPGTDLSENLSTGEKFIQALAANTSESLAEAEALVAPKSSAARYLTNVQRPTGPLTVTKVSEGTHQLCAGTDCSVITDLVLSDGKISTFKVDGKQLR